MSQQLEKLSRRAFLEATGITSSGLLLGASFSAQSAPRAVPQDIISGALSTSDQFLQLNLFVALTPDGTVRIVCHRSEMGQGIRTGLPQVLADEMGADWRRVQVIQGQADKAYGSQNTDGSRSMRDFYLPMRQMGAAARQMLKAAAAQRWDVDIDQLQVQQHQVHDKQSGKSLSFGGLASGAAQQKTPKLGKLTLKSKQDFDYIGKDVANVDMPEMLTGQATYGVDIELPDMVHASIQRCPVLGGRLKTLDASAAKAVAGVIDVIEIKGKALPAEFNALPGVAVIASNTWAAQQGRKKLNIEWQLGDNDSHSSVNYDSKLQQNNLQTPKPEYKAGNVAKALKEAVHIVEANYHVPYLAHASMEPPAATARVDKDSCEIWACSQTPQSAQSTVARELGLKIKQVTVHVSYLGGGFGRKSKPDFIVEAALLAKAVGRPVKVTWSREDDIQFDYLHAVNATRLKAGLDANGQINCWQSSTAFPSIATTFGASDSTASWEFDQGFNDFPFDIDNIALYRQTVTAHVRIGWLRSVINIPAAFAVSSFVDELAIKAGKDSKDFLLQAIGADRTLKPRMSWTYSNYGKSTKQFAMQTKRAKTAINTACERAGWKQDKAQGIGYGLAYHYSFLSHVAVVSKVHWDGNKVKLLAIHCACDVGQVINPDRVKAQFEGAAVFGINIALYSEITVEDGRVEQSNFDGYRLTRLHECPEIDITLIPSDDAPRGVGEPGVPPIAPAIINAIANAGGPRIRKLPATKSVTV